MSAQLSGQPSLASSLDMKPHDLAANVETIAADQMSAAWAALSEEWKTQKLIWESVLLTRTDSEAYQNKIASVSSTIDKAIALGPHGGGSILKQASQVNPGSDNVLTNAVIGAVHDVRRQESLAPERSRLAQELRAFSSNLPAGSLEALVSQCELGDSKLEQDARLALRLARAKTTYNNLLDGAQTMTGSCSGVPKKTSSMCLQTASAAGKARGIPSGKPVSADGLTSGKVVQAAAKVRMATEQRIKDAWQHFEEEVVVQKLVWDSVLQVQTMSKKNPALVNQIAELKSQLERMLTIKDANGAETLRSLEMLLASDLGRQHFGNSLQEVGRKVSREAGLAADRGQLASILDKAATSSAVPPSGAARFDLEALLGKCALDDPQLERRVRQALQIPLPSVVALGVALGPEAKPSQTWSQFSGVTSVWDGVAGPNDMKPVKKKSSSTSSHVARPLTSSQKENQGPLGASAVSVNSEKRSVIEL